MPHKSLLKGVVLAVLLAAVFAGLTWSNDQFASTNPGGNDFYPRYLGTPMENQSRACHSDPLFGAHGRFVAVILSDPYRQ